MLVMVVGWITPQPFVQPYSKSINWAIEMCLSLCVVVHCGRVCVVEHCGREGWRPFYYGTKKLPKKINKELGFVGYFWPLVIFAFCVIWEYLREC